MSYMEGKKNFGLIGCGRIAHTHKEALLAAECCNVVAIADLDVNKAGAMAEECGCQAYSHYKELLDIPNLDAVIIAIPPNEHFKAASMFINKGIHVICEKPITLNSEDARTLFDRAREKNVVVMMAAKFRYVRDVIKAKSIVESGILGNIVHFENSFCSRVDMTSWWNSNPEISGGGVLMDNGCHSVDLVRYLLGPIRKVLTIEGKRCQQIPVEDTVHMIFTTENDVNGTIDLSWSIHKESEYYIAIYGTNGMLTVGWQQSKYRQSEKLDWVEFGQGYNKLQAFKDQFINFVECIDGKAFPLITDEDAFQSIQVVEAAYKSKEHNQWQKI